MPKFVKRYGNLGPGIEAALSEVGESFVDAPPRVARAVDLAAGEVHVGVRDQPALVGGERHPLGEHIVGVGQARAAVGAREIGEGDAVLVQQRSRLGQIGDDRLVRVDQVGVGCHLPAFALAEAAPHAQKPQVSVHRPVALVDTRAQQRARPLLGATLPAGVITGRRRETPALEPDQAPARDRALEPGPDQLPEEHHEDHRTGAQRERHDR